MQIQIVWKVRAAQQLKTAVQYGLIAFGEKAGGEFYHQIRKYDILLSKQPLLGKIEPLLIHRKNEYRSLVVHEHYKLVYYINQSYLYIVAFWDTRREPIRLTKTVK